MSYYLFSVPQPETGGEVGREEIGVRFPEQEKERGGQRSGQRVFTLDETHSVNKYLPTVRPTTPLSLVLSAVNRSLPGQIIPTPHTSPRRVLTLSFPSLGQSPRLRRRLVEDDTQTGETLREVGGGPRMST